MIKLINIALGIVIYFGVCCAIVFFVEEFKQHKEHKRKLKEMKQKDNRPVDLTAIYIKGHRITY